MENGRQKGKVKWFSGTKGYGFIEPLQGGRDLFVHYSAINGKGYRNLLPDEIVEFEVVNTEKGPQARDVCVVGA